MVRTQMVMSKQMWRRRRSLVEVAVIPASQVPAQKMAIALRAAQSLR
jgi:hypothetical protein